MAVKCELIEKCGFFKKYWESKNLVCRGFVRTYCEGDKINECHRKKYRKEHSCPPPDNMMPSGSTVSDSEAQ